MQEFFGEELFDEDLDLSIGDELRDEMFADEDMDCLSPSIMERSKNYVLRNRKCILEKTAVIAVSIITAAVLIKIIKARD